MSSTFHYWTGRGTLCSMDNSVKQKPNHTQVYEAVTCRYCLYQLDLKKPDCAHCAEEKLRGCDHCCWCFKVLRV